MNSVRQLHFRCFAVASAFLLSQSPLGAAITVGELADICEASESAIMDISVDYDWGVEPAPRIEDIKGTGNLIESGPCKCKWSVKRPFGERFLSTEKSTQVNEREESYNSIVMQSYNGEIAKHATISDLSATRAKRVISRGTVTESKRFMPPPNVTPVSFSILRLSCMDDRISLSERLKRRDFVHLDSTVEKINGFNAVRADLLMDSPDVPSMHKLPYLRVYFSIDNGYTPIRYDYLTQGPEGPQSASTIDVTSLEEISEGVWFPNKGVLTNRNREGTLINTYQANRIIVNQGLTDAHFDMEFPPGTMVDDEIARITYVTRPSEVEFNAWLENESALARVAKANEQKAGTVAGRAARTAPTGEQQRNTPAERKPIEPPRATKDGNDNSTLYVLAGIVLAVSVVGVLYVRRRILNRGDSDEHNPVDTIDSH